MNLTPDERRIRQALDQIETPMYDIGAAVNEQRARRGRKMPLRSPHRVAVIAVAAAVLFTVTAAAVFHLSDAWTALFGQNVIVPEDLTTPLQAGQTVDGYTMTLHDAIVTENGVAVICSTQREDGKPLDGMLDYNDIELVRDGKRSVDSASWQSGMEENGTVQYSYGEFDMIKDPGDCELMLTVGPAVFHSASETLTADIDLEKMYREHSVANPEEQEDSLREDAYLPVTDASAALPRAKEFPEISFAGLHLEENMLTLLLRTPAYNPTEGVYGDIVSLLDTRTGETLLPEYGKEYWLHGSSDILNGAVFSGLCEADLPYLRMQIVYAQTLPATGGKWTFTFSAKSAKGYESDLALEVEDGVSVSHITVSPLGVVLEGARPVEEEDSFFRPRPKVSILLKDGGMLATASEGSSSTRTVGSETERFEAHYAYQAAGYSRRFLRTEEIAAVYIDGNRIGIEQ
ncbi:MAG: hypothetical protein ACOYIE_08350 [Agathobaculum sp.]|jgi:hypothetical protein|uniref:hypothetical protein n=1 Tax=Agathobaculum sp. TaxID=2048138 RepID=UPI003D91E3C9